jgi:hypothetical protein
VPPGRDALGKVVEQPVELRARERRLPLGGLVTAGHFGGGGLLAELLLR